MENKEVGEKLIDVPFKVLDDGFVVLKDFMGADEDIEQAARVSYGKGTRKVTETRGLLRYLMRHRHSTPFEMCELKFHIRAPIYVFRQWHRHRTWSYNEYSGRYSEMIDSCQRTALDGWRTQSKTNKQGSSGIVEDWPSDFSFHQMDILDGNGEHFATGNWRVQEFLCEREEDVLTEVRQIYEERLKLGVAKEQARKDLPVSNYSEMYAKVDLKNLFGFLSLRSDSHAQQEIRAYSDIMAGIVKELYPLSFEAWYDYQFSASVWTRLDKELFQLIGKHHGWNLESLKETEKTKILADEIGMSSRELDEFWQKFEVEEKDFSLDYNNLYEV